MPAISPPKLKLQSVRLAEKYAQPEVFVRELHMLLASYADNTYHPGKSKTPSALLDSYATPIPVLRQVWLEMKSIIEIDAQAILTLCDSLWNENSLEHRLLASMLLGQMPTAYASEVTQRLEGWSLTNLELSLQQALIENGFARLRYESAESIIDLAEKVLQNPELRVHQFGLRILQTLVKDIRFENLPAIFKLISPYLRSMTTASRPYLIDLVSSLAQRSPKETAFLLKINLEGGDNREIAWLTRQVVQFFPQEIQASLRQALKLSKTK